MKVAQLCLTLCDPMDYPWNSPGQNTRVDSLSLLQRIFPGIEPRSLALWADYLPAEPQGNLRAQTVKHLPAMRETLVRSLGQEDSLEKEMATHSSTLALKIWLMEEPGRLQSMGSQRVGHNWATSLFFLSFFGLFLSLCLQSFLLQGLAYHDSYSIYFLSQTLYFSFLKVQFGSLKIFSISVNLFEHTESG